MSDSPIDLSHPKVLLYGEPGVGKTTWICSAARTMKMVLINVDAGIMSLDGLDYRPIIKNIGNKVISQVDLIQATEALLWNIIAGKGEFAGVQAIGLDSVSELQNRDLENLAAGKDDVERDDYRKSTTRLRRVLRLLRDAPFTVLVTALSKNISDQKGNTVKVYPALSRAAAESINGFMDAVWFGYLDPKDNEPVILTKRRGPIFVKGRGPFNRFPEVLRKIEFPQIYATVQAAGEKK